MVVPAGRHYSSLSNHPTSSNAVQLCPAFITHQIMKPKSIHPRARLSSFGYAIRGLGSLLRQEPNARLHAAATIAVIAFGIYRNISRNEWIALTMVIALVWITEALNTCVEMLCDLWCKGEYHPKVKIIKDIAAAAVIIAALCAVVTGLIIFCF
jgi:diacylglycerol kinase